MEKEMAALLLLFVYFNMSVIDVSSGWSTATATFYGGSDGSGTMGGACGYGNLYSTDYGTDNTALSSELFDNGATCGACFQIVCNARQSQWCRPRTHITVTATNYCPPNYELASDNGGWCNSPRRHFDMSQPAWETIAIYRGGIVPVYYRRVKCKRSGGVRFTINGRSYFELVLISNVGGTGVISAAWIKGSNTDWMAMGQNWGMNWQSNAYLTGQSLSFRLQTDDEKIRTAYDVVPSNWQFGSTYQSSIQFK